MLYIFNQDDKYQNIITEETGLIDTWFKDYQNHLIDEPFVFHVESDSDLLHLIKDENQVAFYDRDNRLRLMRIKGLHERSTSDGYIVEVICEPSFLELYDHFVEDRRINNGTAQSALNAVLQGSRYTGNVTVVLGNQTTNFYWINGIDAILKIINTWGGALVDTIELDENNEIIERKIIIQQRLGADNGLLIEPDYNAESIERSTLSYPVTAMYGQGASLETDNGGYTRYITFEDVEWKVSKGDPVDKPKGQKWVGDPQALAKYGYLHNNQRKHRFGHFSNQDYETPEELLMATWLALQEAKHPEVNHESTINVDRPVSLGDTATIIDRNYNKPIEVQSQITGLEYDILEPDEQVKVVLGKYVDMNVDPLEKELDDLKQEVARPKPTKPIDNSSFPDVKPGIPVNVQAHGMFQAIMINWEYDSAVYISHYELYGSQTADFVPDSQYLIYKGRVSAFGHEVGSNETWYYRVRAVNTRGTVSNYSVQVSASSTRIDFIDMADEIQQEIDDAKSSAQTAVETANQSKAEAESAINKANESFGKAENALASSSMALQQSADAYDKSLDAFDKAQESLDEIGNLEISERNLILGSANPYTFSVAENNFNYWIVYRGLEKNTTYTFSAKVEILQGEVDTVSLYPYVQSGQSMNRTEMPIIDGKIIGTITTDGRYNYNLLIYNGKAGETTGNRIRLTEYQLVKGNKAPLTWQEAPEDVNQKIQVVADDLNGLSVIVDNNKNEIMSISATAQGLQTQVTNNKNDLSTVTQTANANQQQIQNARGDINSLTQTATALQNRLSNAEGNINTITNLATGTQQSLVNLQGDFTRLNTTVGGLQTEVNKKVDQTTYNTKVQQLDNAISQRVTKTDANNLYTQKTEFNQFADGFSQRVDAIEGWEIGGRNYLKNSKDFNENWTKSSTANISIENADESGFKQIKEMSSDVNSYIGQRTSLIGFDFNDENVEFSISVYAKGTKVGQTIGITLGGGSYLNYLPKPLTIDWKVYTWTFKGIGASLQVFRFNCGGDVNTSNPIYWKMPKVAIGRKITDWSPAPEDTDQKFSAITQTIDNIDQRVQTNSSNYSSISQTVQGIQNTVANKADKSTVTQLAGVVDTKISTTDANNKFATQSQLTQTSNSLTSTISRIENIEGWETGTTNLILGTSSSFKTANWSAWNVTPSTVRFQAEVGQEYTARVYYRNVTGINVGLRIFWYNSAGALIVESPNSNSIAIGSEGYAELTHKAPTGAVEGNVALRRTSPSGTGSAQYKELILVKGNKIGSWQPAPEDMATQSQISQLDSAINLRVKEGDVLSQINIEANRTLIQSNKLILDADTVTVTGTFRVNNANISSVDAGKMTTGTLNAALVNIINLNASNISTGTLQAINITGSRIVGGSFFNEGADGDVRIANGRISATNFWAHENGVFSSDKGFTILRSYDDWIYLQTPDEVRVTKPRTYNEYSDLRAKDILTEGRFYSKGNYIGQNNTVFGSDNGFAMLRTASWSDPVYLQGERVIVTKPGEPAMYSQLTANTIKSMNGNFEGTGNTTFTTTSGYTVLRSSSNAQLVYLQGSEIRATQTTNANNYVAYRGSNFIRNDGKVVYFNATGSESLYDGTALIANGIRTDSSNFYIGVDTAARITSKSGYNNGNGITYKPIFASAFNEASSREYKTEINDYKGEALEVIRNLTVVNYRLKDDIANGIDDIKIGFIAEDSEAIATLDKKAIQSYKISAYNTKAIQELDLKLDLTREELVFKIAELEEKIMKLESAA